MLTEGQFLTPRYRIVGLLKRGGMGAVYEGYDLLLKARVAVKENLRDDPDARAAFEREAELLANLQHPSLPRCCDLLTVDGKLYIVMEFIEGEDLSATMAQARAPLTNAVVRDLAWQLLDALEYLHEQPVYHRDIKPGNIKTKDGRVRLLDLGLAYGLSGEMETLVGGEFNWSGHTRRYAPPEQLRFDRTTPASDVFSLGATLYYLLTNVQPPDAGKRADSVARHEGDFLEDVRLYNEGADERLAHAVMSALSLDPDERPQRARDMREMIFREKSDQPERARAPRRVSVRLVSEALMLVALAVLLFLFLAPSRRGGQPAPPAPGPPPSVQSEVLQPLAAELTPGEESARLTDEAVLLRRSGKEAEAWGKFKRALELDKKNVYARAQLYDMIWEADGAAVTDEEMQEIVEQADIILRSTSSRRSVRECVARAWAYLAKSEYDEAAALAEDALTKYDPNCVDALAIRAAATATKAGKQIDEQTGGNALTDYDRVLAAAPNYAQAYANRAEIHLAMGLASRRRNAGLAGVNHLECARDDLERALGLSARPGFFKRLGDVHLAMRNMEAARDNYLKATQADPECYQAYIKLAELSIHAGDWGGAEMNYLEALRVNTIPQAPRALSLQRLCAIYNNLGQFDAAEKNCRLALKLDPNDGEAKKQLERAMSGRSTGG